MIKSFAGLIGSWPRDGKQTSIRTFASDVRLPYLNAQMMRHRNSIPSSHWLKVAAAAQKRGLRHVTVELLAEMYVRRWNKDARPSGRETCQAA